MYYAFGIHTYISHMWHICIPGLADIFPFPYLCQSVFTLYTCVSLHNTNAY